MSPLVQVGAFPGIGLRRVADLRSYPGNGLFCRAAHGGITPDTTSLPLSLRRNISWTFVGNTVYTVAQWAMLAVIAKLGTPTMVGQFALGLAIAAPVMMLANMQLRAVQATDARGDFEFAEYVGVRLVTTVLALMMIAGVWAFAGYPGQTALVILFVGFAKAVESLNDLLYGLFQRNERMDRVAHSLIRKGLLSVVFLTAVLVLTASIASAVASVAVAWLLVLLWDCSYASRLLGVNEDGYPRIRPSFNIARLQRLTALAVPLGFVMMLISLNASIPRFVVERVMGEAELGIFAALAYIVVAGQAIVGALGQSATPRLANMFAQGDVHGFRRLYFTLVASGAVVGLVGILIAALAGRPLLTLLYTNEYGDYNGLLVLVMVAGLFGYVAAFQGYALTATRRFRIQMPLALATSFATLVCSVLLVPVIGLYGAAWTMLTAHVVQAVLYGVAVRSCIQAAAPRCEGR
jgi:O-antigen/teichoic acid export membrane protein